METSLNDPNTEAKPSPGKLARTLGWGAVFFALFALLAMVALGMRRNSEGPIVVGQQVPEFTFHTFSGEQITLTEMKGKVVVLNFWASWCVTCDQEAADLQTAWENYSSRGDVVFLGADYVDTEPEALKYMERFGVSYINGPDLGTRLSQAFKVRAVPETYIIDQDGKLAYVKIGPFQSLAEIEAAIDPLLAP